jgi:hypothetical protein
MGGLRAAGGWLTAGAILVGAALAARTDAGHVIPSDPYLFAAAGSVMLSAHWTQAFAAQAVQAGPLELGLTSAARSMGGGAEGFAVVLDVACTAAMLAVAATFFSRKTVGLALFGIAAFALGLPGAAYAGHPAEPLIGVLWLVAAREARRGRPTRAGLLVGISAGFELWGILGVTVLALAPRLRRCAPGVVLAAALPVVSLLPFVLGGDFHMFQMQWTILRGVPRLLFGYHREFTWPLRVAEGAVVVAVGVAVARTTRRLPESVWLVPAATVLTRILLDPETFGYYWDTPLFVLLLGGTALALRPGELRERLAARFPSLAS